MFTFMFLFFSSRNDFSRQAQIIFAATAHDFLIKWSKRLYILIILRKHWIQGFVILRIPPYLEGEIISKLIFWLGLSKKKKKILYDALKKNAFTLVFIFVNSVMTIHPNTPLYNVLGLWYIYILVFVIECFALSLKIHTWFHIIPFCSIDSIP